MKQKLFHAHNSSPQSEESGSAVVGQVLTGILTIIVTATLLQFVYLAYARIVMIDTAGEAARYAARFAAPTSAAQQRAQTLLADSIPAAKINAIHVSESPLAPGTTTPRPLLKVNIHAELPLVGPWLRFLPVTVQGHALKETVD